MLVLSRKKGQRIHIGDEVTVTVLGVQGGTIRLGIEGPANVPIHREEVYQRIRREEPLSRSVKQQKVLKAG